MIFVHSIISGYICLQGSFVIHIPMFLAMLNFVEVPDRCDLVLGFPRNEDVSRWTGPEHIEAWYKFCLALHAILALIHLASIFCDEFIDQYLASGFMIVQLSAVLLQIANLCYMLNLYGNSVLQGTTITPEARLFQFWILIEISVMFCTIINSMFYLILRSLRRDLVFYQQVEVPDTTMDFMSSVVKILQLTIVFTACGPTMVNAILWFAPFLEHKSTADVQADMFSTSDASIEILK